MAEKSERAARAERARFAVPPGRRKPTPENPPPQRTKPKNPPPRPISPRTPPPRPRPRSPGAQLETHPYGRDELPAEPHPYSGAPGPEDRYHRPYDNTRGYAKPVPPAMRGEYEFRETPPDDLPPAQWQRENPQLRGMLPDGSYRHPGLRPRKRKPGEPGWIDKILPDY
jgi:hypothetical protein